MAENKKNCAVGIVTYNPDISRLKKNIESVQTNINVDLIIIIDNNSNNISQLIDIIKNYANIKLIQHTKNRGIACALNEICNYAKCIGYTNVLTLDQDSIPQPHLVDKLLKNANDKTGILCPRTEDLNMGRQYITKADGCDNLDLVITSGNLVNLDAWEKVGKFDESLFIDGVDFDFCIRMKANGYFIHRINSLYILHEVGHGKTIHILGRQMSVMNHTPLRLYYIIRNYLFIGKKHHQQGYWTKEVVKRIFIVTCFEHNRLKKWRYIIRGFIDYKLNKSGKLDD